LRDGGRTPPRRPHNHVDACSFWLRVLTWPMACMRARLVSFSVTTQAMLAPCIALALLCVCGSANAGHTVCDAGSFHDAATETCAPCLPGTYAGKPGKRTGRGCPDRCPAGCVCSMHTIGVTLRSARLFAARCRRARAASLHADTNLRGTTTTTSLGWNPNHPFPVPTSFLPDPASPVPGVGMRSHDMILTQWTQRAHARRHTSAAGATLPTECFPG